MVRLADHLRPMWRGGGRGYGWGSTVRDQHELYFVGVVMGGVRVWPGT